ncbi:MAG TPA: FAD-linked oxidase C-terminal domain-containing protein [Gammaproteobacteria bacterium]|nr:FAD-linked oxidase C-terminal domain-containing protein [Gammaproteobacteria bacterium]
MSARDLHSLHARLRRELAGDVLFDSFARGRYSTDASIYQIEPLGVVVPRSGDDALRALEIASAEGVPVLPRGAGTSQCGQTVGAALVIDTSKHLNNVLELDAAAQTAWVEPGTVLDALNAALKPRGLWYPVDVSTSAQATIGGMTANNSCGARSLRYGNMVHNVLAAETWLSSGETVVLGEVAAGAAASGASSGAGAARERELVAAVRALYARERDELEARVPKVSRRVAGYNLDMASASALNMAHLAVGSEGTLGYFRRIKLKLAALPRHKALGIVHFPTFYQAMDLTRHIVALDPAAVELVDRTMIELAREIAAFRPTVEKTIRGEPDAILLVEFAGDELAPQAAKLRDLVALMGDLGLPGSVVEVTDAGLQRDVWEVRKAGLNIMMSMKGDGKPVSFIEDCAVPLEHLADYTARLTDVFAKHGTRGTFYAHASVGCLHVRPVLDMRAADGAAKMRSIAEEACALVKEYKGSYSGEHGDGLVRSEWIEPIYGARLARAFAELKRAFDPKGLMNPGKIVAAPKMDDRALFRFKPDYRTLPVATGLDWSEHEVGPQNRGRGFAAAVEMCNNNGHCRKFDAGTMCPSYRVTRDEQHVTRGRANSLRLALSGQLGPNALESKELYDTLALCVSCKGCKRECPTGVDMARMKAEFLHHYHRRTPRSLRDKLVAHLPRYAPTAARLAPLMNLRDRVPGLATLSERVLGFAARRTLPVWRRDRFRGQAEVAASTGTREVVLLADTFNTYFEPDNLRAAVRVLGAGGYRVIVAAPADGGRPLCCGRTYLASGMLDEARVEARRMLAALGPDVARGVPVVGLEPSCLLGLRDEFAALLPGAESAALAAAALTFEEFLAREQAAGRLALPLQRSPYARALVHGHCHQKAFGAMPPVVAALKLVPELAVEVVQSSCCGMAGSFGYQAEHVDVSLRMAELSLLPAVRAAAADTVVVADGTSCRHQIHDGAAREAVHVARVLAESLA